MNLDTLLLVAVLSGRPGGQVASQAPGSAGQLPATVLPRWELGVDYQRDRFSYRFENPSSFDTPEPVPHWFEQHYDADNLWIAGRVRFALGGRRFESEGGVSAAAAGVGSDYDIFAQPGGNVIVYGTTAVTDTWSWRAAQHVELGSWAGVRWRVGYSYRRDRADFRPSETTITQSKPPSTVSFWNTSRETTISEVHEVRIGADQWFTAADGWLIRVTADAAPTTLARLTTQLPDKYPEPVVSIAKSMSVNASLNVKRRFGSWQAGTILSFARAWGYRDANDYDRSAFSAGMTISR